MKVLFLSRRYLPHQGGVETHLAQVCRELKARHQITIVTEQHDSKLSLHEVIDGVEVQRIPLPNQQTNKQAIWRWWVKNWRLLWSADVIHIHDVFFWFLPFRLIFFWKKVLITFHGYEGSNPTRTQVFWHQVAELGTDANLCIGGFHQKWYGVTPTVTSYGGVAVDEVQPAPKRQQRAVFVGRLAADTGIWAYLQAWQILHQDKKAVNLDVFGEGPLLSACQKFVKDHHLPVQFHGVTKAPLTIFPKYQVACVSGYLTMLEAMSVGTPVIATYDLDIKRDYLRQTPFAQWITITQSPVEVAQAVMKRQPLLKAAQNWARQQTWLKLAESYETLWQNI